MNPSLPVILSEAKNLSGRSRVNSDLIFDMLDLIFDMSALRLASLVSLCLALPAALIAGPADRIAAVVGNQIILQSEVDAGTELLRFQMPPAESGKAQAPDSALRRQVLEELIGNQVILEQARRETLSVTKEDADAMLKDEIKTLKARFGSADSFAEALKREGLTEAALTQRYRDEATQRLTARELLAKHHLLETAIVTPTEVQQFYSSHRDSFGSIPGRVRLAHILFVPRPSEQTEQKAYEQIVQAYVGLVQSKWDFEAVATSFSTDEDVKRKAGLIGNVERGDLPEEVDSVLFSLPVGEFSKPFRSRLGWQIIKREPGSGGRTPARQILIAVPATWEDTNRARAQAEAIAQRARSGEDFAALAREYSDDPTTKMTDGLLGEFFLKGLAPPYSYAVESLPAGGVSKPIQSEHGFHIFKVLERVDEKIPTYDELQDDIRNYLSAQKLKAKLDEFVKEHSQRISIQRF
jgi:peptidyl-prolyl cis-trans isomerase SurA